MRSYRDDDIRDYRDVVESFILSGWSGPPIDAVQLPSGEVTTLDNARLAAALDTKTEVQANVHPWRQRLPGSEWASRFSDPWHPVPRTWGDAAALRIDNQGPDWAAENPTGSAKNPGLT